MPLLPGVPGLIDEKFPEGDVSPPPSMLMLSPLGASDLAFFITLNPPTPNTPQTQRSKPLEPLTRTLAYTFSKSHGSDHGPGALIRHGRI